MAKILEFPSAPKKPANPELEFLTPKQAVDAIVLGMLEVAMPIWVEREWPFIQLEAMAYELRKAMSVNVPEDITRYHVNIMVAQLKPSWEALIREVDPNFF